MKLYGVWYYDVIVRGPFANKRLANAALKEVIREPRSRYKVGEWNPEKDAQIPGWTNPSVLLMCAKDK